MSEPDHTRHAFELLRRDIGPQVKPPGVEQAHRTVSRRRTTREVVAACSVLVAMVAAFMVIQPALSREPAVTPTALDSPTSPGPETPTRVPETTPMGGPPHGPPVRPPAGLPLPCNSDPVGHYVDLYPDPDPDAEIVMAAGPWQPTHMSDQLCPGVSLTVRWGSYSLVGGSELIYSGAVTIDVQNPRQTIVIPVPNAPPGCWIWFVTTVDIPMPESVSPDKHHGREDPFWDHKHDAEGIAVHSTPYYPAACTEPTPTPTPVPMPTAS